MLTQSQPLADNDHPLFACALMFGLQNAAVNSANDFRSVMTVRNTPAHTRVVAAIAVVAQPTAVVQPLVAIVEI